MEFSYENSDILGFQMIASAQQSMGTSFFGSWTWDLRGLLLFFSHQKCVHRFGGISLPTGGGGCCTEVFLIVELTKSFLLHTCDSAKQA